MSAMRVIACVRTHDDLEVADALVAFHLHAGADFVIATDHRSTDGTRDVLREYERAGVLELILEDGEELRSAAWRTTMARRAAALGADWTFSADSDELWWPRGASYGEALGAVPADYGAVRCPWRPFLPVREQHGPFWARMTTRLTPPAPLHDPGSPYRPNWKVAHRAVDEVFVHRGNHAIRSEQLRMLEAWHPLEVLHYPVRSLEQQQAKAARWLELLEARNVAIYRRTATMGRARATEYFETLALDGPARSGAAREGVITCDTRVRRLLESVRLPGAPTEPVAARTFALPGELARPAVLPQPTLADDVDFALEIANARGADLVRARRRLGEQTLRVDALAIGRR
jgi:glycosyl transferase family 2